MAAHLETALHVLKNAPEIVEKLNTAIGAIKAGLHNVKVSKYEADQLERQLQGELFDKWHERCEVMKATKIPSKDIKSFLDHMEGAYEGINNSIRKKMEGVLFVEETWEYKILEWKFNTGSDSGALYGMMAFGKSPDKKYFDCMYVVYTMDFKISKREIITEKKHTILFGIYSWTTEDVERSDRKIGTKSAKALQNFFRLKALQGFYKEGVTESICYVDSLDDIPAQ